MTRFALPLAAALLSAALMNLGDTLDPLWWAEWLVPIPLLYASFRLGAGRAALLVATTALLGALTAAHGLLAVGPVPAILFTMGRVLELTALVLMTRRLMRGRAHWLLPFAYPALAAGIDMLIATTLPDGAAGSPAMTQIDALPVIQIAAVTGRPGIVFALGLFAATVAIALHLGRRIERPGLAYGLPALVLAAIVAYGFARLAGPADAGGTVPVGLAAIDGTIEDYVAAGAPEAPLWARYVAQIAALARRGAAIVVLPEKLGRIMAGAEGPVRDRLAAIARDDRVHLVAGVMIHAADHDENRSWLFAPDGALVGDYSKQHMVPGFEDAYRPGHEAMLRDIGGTPYGLAICKDMDFPALGRDYGRLGARALLVPAWDFGADGHYHDRMAVMLGVEGGFSLFRAAKDGLMTVSDRHGRVLAAAPSGENENAGRLFVAAAPLADGVPTLYARFGDWFGWGCLAFWLAFIAWGRLGRRRSAAAPALA